MSIVYHVFPDLIKQISGVLYSEDVNRMTGITINSKLHTVRYCVPLSIKYYPKSNKIRIHSESHVPLNTQQSLQFIGKLGYSSFDRFKRGVFNNVVFHENHVQKDCFYCSFQDGPFFAPSSL